MQLFDSSFFSPKIFLLLVAITNGACITLVRPQGDWIKPVDLRLHDESLKGITIEMVCGAGDRGKPAWEAVSDNKACAGVATSLRNLGAEVYVEEYDTDGSENFEDAAKKIVDFKLVYVDRETTSDYCGWTLPFYLMSFTLFPCVADMDSSAELRFYDQEGTLSQKEELVTNVRKVFGAGAVVMLLARLANLREHSQFKKRNHANLIISLQNIAYTHAMRLKLAETPGFQLSDVKTGKD